MYSHMTMHEIENLTSYAFLCLSRGDLIKFVTWVISVIEN